VLSKQVFLALLSSLVLVIVIIISVMHCCTDVQELKECQVLQILFFSVFYVRMCEHFDVMYFVLNPKP